jgi:hypothetical protein
MDINELNDRADKYLENVRQQRRKNYHYAKQKGFTPAQAQILASKSTEEIDRLAKERDNG